MQQTAKSRQFRSLKLAGALLALAQAVQCAAADPAPERAVPFPAQPELLGEGTVSTNLHDFAPSLARDGRTLFFTRTDFGFSRMTLMQSQLVNGKWQEASVLPFSGRWNDGDGTLSPDGSRYVFISNRPASGGQAKADLDLWMAERKSDGNWGEPVRLPDTINTDVNEVYPSIAQDGTLYFGRAGSDQPIFRSRLVDGKYQAPERLPFKGFSFAIAPDQGFGILGVTDASRNSDLYYVRRDGEGWSAPRRLDGPVNSPFADLAGSITADGKTLLFVSNRLGAKQPWPRARQVKSAADVAAELEVVAGNGLRNIYSIDLSGLPTAAQ